MNLGLAEQVESQMLIYEYVNQLEPWSRHAQTKNTVITRYIPGDAMLQRTECCQL